MFPTRPTARSLLAAAALASAGLAAAAEPLTRPADAPSRRAALVMPHPETAPGWLAFPGHDRPAPAPADARLELARLCEAPTSRALPACWCAGYPVHVSCGGEAATSASSSAAAAAIVPPPATQALLRRYGR